MRWPGKSCSGGKKQPQCEDSRGEKLVARQTYSKRCFPETPEFNAVLRDWKKSGSMVLLTIVWEACDRFHADELARIDCSRDDKDSERDITQLLEPKMHDLMSGFEPFYVQHEAYERESLKAPPARPHQYDIAFVLRRYPRVMWPLEAKVLRTDGQVAEYVNEVECNFLTCRYSPFSSEAAMLGYLLSGDCEIAFANIAQKGKWELRMHEGFAERDHRVSEHGRNVPAGKDYPRHFRCHHMLLRVGAS